MKIIDVYVTDPYRRWESIDSTCGHNPTGLTARINEPVMWECGCLFDPTGSQAQLMKQASTGQMVELSDVVTNLAQTGADVFMSGVRRAARPIRRLQGR